MASMLDDFFGTSPANPMAPFVDTDPADLERQRFADPLNVGGLIPAAPVSAYKPIFRYDNPEQTDWDFDGSKTVEAGKILGTGWDADYVAELQLPGGKVVSRDEILAQEGGRALLDLMSRKRKGRRGFVEALTQGSGWDFVPYAGDIASLGVSIRNMSKVRDTMRKIEEQGVDKLSTQELVFAKLYMEDMERQTNSTWGGKVGGIVRMAPAFAAEFLTSGLLFKAATKGLKALGLVAREGSKRFVSRAATTAAVSQLRKARVATGAMAHLTDDVMGEIAERVTKDTMQTGAMRAFAKSGMEAAKNAMEKTAAGLSRQQVYEAAFSAVKAADTAMNTPGGLRSFGRFLSEYASRGLLEHGHSILRETSPGIMYKLRNAAGIAFVEAPVRGGLYAAFDFFGVNPLIGKLAGADETVTKQELQFSLSNDPQTRSMAKWLAFGAAWAEYASENAGDAMDDVLDIAKDLSKVTGRGVAKGALVAKGPVNGVTNVQKGSFMRRLLDQMMGSEDDLIKGVSDVRTAAKKLAVEAGEEFGEKHLRQAAHDLKYKAFASFVIADKAARLGITPQAVARTFENMGYDGILGEFMEERYSGFLQGLFGLDEKPSRPFLERLAAAWDQAIPDTTSDAFAEIVAFAIPAGVRTASAMAYRGLGGTIMDRAHNFSRAYTELTDAVNNGLVAEEAGKVKGVTQIKTSEEGTGSVTEETRKNTTRAEGYEGRLASQGRLADDLAEITIGARPMAEPGNRRGLVNRAAGFLIKAVNAVVSGSVHDLFNDPVNALMQEELGNLGRVMRHEADISFKSIYKKVAQSRAAERDPNKPFDAAKEHEAIMAEVRPLLRKVTGGIVKTALKSRGVLTADAAAIDAFIDTLPKDAEGKINGLKREDFVKEFKDQLHEAAAGRMRADVINDSVRFTYQRAPTTSVSVAVKEMERFIAKELGVAAYVDTTDPTYTPAEDLMHASEALPADVVRLAAEEGDSVEAMGARIDLVKMMDGGFRLAYGSGDVFERRLENARDYARGLLAVQEGLSARAYANEAGRVVAEVTMRNGVATITDLSAPLAPNGQPQRTAMNGKTWETVDAEMAKRNLTHVQGTGDIVFVSGSGMYYEDAAAALANSMLQHYYDEYLVANARAVAPNPYAGDQGKTAAGRAEIRADLAKARAWAAADRDQARYMAENNASEADATQAASLWDSILNDGEGNNKVLGWEYAAEQALAQAGLKAEEKPGDRSRKGYLFNASVYTKNGTLYLPYRYLGNLAGLIEDATEIRIKQYDGAVLKALETPDSTAGGPVHGLFGSAVVRRMADGRPVMRGVYRPSARAAIAATQEALLEVSRNDQLSDRTRNEAAWLAQTMFNPNVYSHKALEALSHLSTGVYYQQADAHLRGDGTAGSAFYATLGHAAPILRSEKNRPVMLAFGSLLNRMVNNGVQDVNMDALKASVLRLTPAKFRDAALKAILPNPAANEAEWLNANRIPEDAFRPFTVMSRADQVKLVNGLWAQATVGGGDVRSSQFLPEDYPQFARAVLAGLTTEQAQAEAGDQGAPADATPPAPLAQAAAQQNAGAVADAGKGDATASLADVMEDNPLMYSILAKSYAKYPQLRFGRILSPVPDPETERDAFKSWVFDFWSSAQTGLSEADFKRFSEAYNKAVPPSDPAAEKFAADIDAFFNDEPWTAPTEDTLSIFEDDAARENLHRNGLKLQPVLAALFPGSLGEIGHAVQLWRELAERKGDTGPDGLRALLSNVDGETEVHPALTRETFQPWLDKRLQSTTSADELLLYATLDAYGFEASARFLTAFRGSVYLQGVAVVAAKKQNDAEYSPVAGQEEGIGPSDWALDEGPGSFGTGRVRPARRSGTSATGSTVRAVKAKRLALGDAGARQLYSQVNTDMEAMRGEFQDKSALGRAIQSGNRTAQIEAVVASAEKLAAIADRMFGEGSLVASALRSRPALTRFVDEVAGDSGKPLQYALASQASFGGHMYANLKYVARALAEGRDPAEAVELLHTDAWLPIGKYGQRPFGDTSSYSRLFDFYGESIPQSSVVAGNTRHKLLAPRLDDVSAVLVTTDLFKKVSKSTNPAASDADVERLAARGLYADGTPFKALITEVTDANGRTLYNPTRSQVVQAALSLLSSAPSDPRMMIPIVRPGGDKKAITAYLVPWSLLNRLSGTAADKYNHAYKRINEETNAAEIKGKRQAPVFGGVAQTAPLGTKTRVTVVAGEDNKGEGFHGSATGLEGPAFAAAEDQAYDKFHIQGADPRKGYLFYKGLFLRVVESMANDPALHPYKRAAAKAIVKSLKHGYAQAAVLDEDGFKLDPRRALVLELLRGTKDADTEFEVDGAKTTAKALGYEVGEMEVGTDDKGQPIMRRTVSFDASTVIVRAASLYDTAVPHLAEEPILNRRPFNSEDRKRTGAVYDMARQIDMAYDEQFGEKTTPAEAEMDAAVRARIEDGTIPYGPHLLNRILAHMISGNIHDPVGLGYGVHWTATGAAPAGYGANPHVAVRDGYRDTTGVYHPALVQANVRGPWVRPALKFNEADPRIAGRDEAEKRAALEKAIVALEATPREDNAEAFLKALADVQKMLVYQNGDALPAGRAYSFADLVENGVFDKSAWSAQRGQPTLLGGTFVIVSRVPGVDPTRARHLCRLSGPATSAASGSKVRAASLATGKAARVDVGPYDAADDAILAQPGGQIILTGNDYDGDTMFGILAAYGDLGSIDLPAVNLGVTLAAIRAAKTQRDAKRILNTAYLGLSNQIFQARKAMLRDGLYGTPTKTDVNFISEELLERLSGGASEFSMTDAVADARLSDAMLEEAELRGVMVALGASLSWARALDFRLIEGVGPMFFDENLRAAGPHVSNHRLTDKEHSTGIASVDSMANATYDNTKQIARLVKAGFGQPFLQMFAVALYYSDNREKENIDFVGESFSLWTKSAVGRAIRRQYESTRDPSIKPVVQFPSQAEDLAFEVYGVHEATGAPNHPLWRHADPDQRMMVAAAAMTVTNSDPKAQNAARAKIMEGLLQMFAAARMSRDVKAVLEANKNSVISPRKYTQLTEAIKRLENGSKHVATAVTITPEFAHTRRLQEEAWDILRGHIAFALDDNMRTRQEPISEHSIKTREIKITDDHVLLAAQALGVVAATPRDLLEKVLRAVDSGRGRNMVLNTLAPRAKYSLGDVTRTQGVKRFIEGLMAELLANHKQRVEGVPYGSELVKEGQTREFKGRINPFLAALRLPHMVSAGGKWRYAPGPRAITMRGNDTADTAAFAAGFERLNGADAADRSLDVTFPVDFANPAAGMVTLTTRDMYHLLKLYAGLVAEIPLKPGRSARTFGGHVAASLSDILYATRDAAAESSPTVLADMAFAARAAEKTGEYGDFALALFDQPSFTPDMVGTFDLATSRAKTARPAAKPAVVEKIAPASREAQAEAALDYEAMTLETADRLYTETGDERALARVEELRAQMARGEVAPAAPAAPTGFQGYKGGFEDVGKGTPAGDGKDKAMRDVVTSAKVPGFIGEIADTERRSSTKTSLLEIASHAGGNSTKTAGVTHSSLPMFMGSGDGYAAGEFKVMLARNGELGGRPLTADTAASVRAAAKAGASFVVGDMPGVDSAFVDLLRDIGAPFEIYHTGSTPRIRAEAAPTSTPASSAAGAAKEQMVAPEQTFQPTTFAEAEKVLTSRNTILSNSEARVFAKKLGLGPGAAMPRVLVATERTDPVWFAKEVTAKVATGEFDALYIITKHDGLPIRDLLQLPIPKLIHFSMTTLGGTVWEPGVMRWRDLMARVEDFIAQGLDPMDMTIRVDPLVPGVTDMNEVRELLGRAVKVGVRRLRFSVMDGYSGQIEAKIRSLYQAAGVNMDQYYARDGRVMAAKQNVVDSMAQEFLKAAKDAGVDEVGSCAERISLPGVNKEGCLPTEAVSRLLGRDIANSKSSQRQECMCFGGKVDGLAYSDKCAGACAYCYARHGSDPAAKYYDANGALKVNRFTETRPASSPASVAVSKAVAETANAAANTEITQGLFDNAQAQLAVLRMDPSAEHNKKAAEAFGAGLVAAVSTTPWADAGIRAAAARAAEAIAAIGYVSPKLAAGAWLAVGSAARRQGNDVAVEQISELLRGAKLGTTVLTGEYLTAHTIQPTVAEVGKRVRAASAFDAAVATLGYAAAMTPGIKSANAAAVAARDAFKALGLQSQAPQAPQAPRAIQVTEAPRQQGVSTVARIAAETTKEDPIVVYSDGSDIKGTGMLGYGAWASWRGTEYEISGTNETAEGRELQRQYPDLKFSNPTMEMLALAAIVENFRGQPVHLLVRQDYKGAVNYDGLWQRAVANTQRGAKPWKAKEVYIAALRDRAVAAIASIEAAGGSVRIEWVRGHQTGGGEIARGNDNADRAAKSRGERNDFVLQLQTAVTAAPESSADVSASLAAADVDATIHALTTQQEGRDEQNARTAIAVAAALGGGAVSRGQLETIARIENLGVEDDTLEALTGYDKQRNVANASMVLPKYGDKTQVLREIEPEAGKKIIVLRDDLGRTAVQSRTTRGLPFASYTDALVTDEPEGAEIQVRSTSDAEIRPIIPWRSLQSLPADTIESLVRKGYIEKIGDVWHDVTRNLAVQGNIFDEKLFAPVVSEIERRLRADLVLYGDLVHISRVSDRSVVVRVSVHHVLERAMQRESEIPDFTEVIARASRVVTTVLNEFSQTRPLEGVSRNSIQPLGTSHVTDAWVGVDLVYGPTEEEAKANFASTLAFLEAVYPGSSVAGRILDAIQRLVPDFITLIGRSRLVFSTWSQEQWDEFFTKSVLKGKKPPAAFIRRGAFGREIVVNPSIPPGFQRLQAAMHELGHGYQFRYVESTRGIAAGDGHKLWSDFFNSRGSVFATSDLAGEFVSTSYPSKLWSSEYFAEVFSYWIIDAAGLVRRMGVAEGTPDVAPEALEAMQRIVNETSIGFASKSSYTRRDTDELPMDTTTPDTLRPIRGVLAPTPVRPAISGPAVAGADVSAPSADDRAGFEPVALPPGVDRVEGVLTARAEQAIGYTPPRATPQPESAADVSASPATGTGAASTYADRISASASLIDADAEKIRRINQSMERAKRLVARVDKPLLIQVEDEDGGVLAEFKTIEEAKAYIAAHPGTSIGMPGELALASSVDFAEVAQGIEEWKQAEGIRYNPQDAYDRGEAFYHDIGAFNSEAPGLLGDLVRVLDEQEKLIAASDNNWWEKTKDRLIVSAYTAGSTPEMPSKWETPVYQYSRNEDGTWTAFAIAHQVAYPMTEKNVLLNWIQYVGSPVRPGTGLRFVIAPMSDDIVWAAAHDVYSGTVTKTTPRRPLLNEEYFPKDAWERQFQVWREGHMWRYEQEAIEKFGKPPMSVDDWAKMDSGYTGKDESKPSEITVETKAPAAQNLSQVSDSVAAAIDGRQSDRYNELGIRLRYGNFYIEERPAPSKEDLPFESTPGEGEKYEDRGGVPKELQPLNELLKAAYIKTHGSLDPMPQPATAATDVSASLSDSISDTVNQFYGQAAVDTSKPPPVRAEPTSAADKFKKKHSSEIEKLANRLLLNAGPDARMEVAKRTRAAVAVFEALQHANVSKGGYADAVSILTDLADHLEIPSDGDRYAAWPQLTGSFSAEGGHSALGRRVQEVNQLLHSEGYPNGVAQQFAIAREAAFTLASRDHALETLARHNQPAYDALVQKFAPDKPFNGEEAVRDVLEAADETAAAHPFPEALKSHKVDNDAASVIAAVATGATGAADAATRYVVQQFDAAEGQALPQAVTDAIKEVRTAAMGNDVPGVDAALVRLDEAVAKAQPPDEAQPEVAKAIAGVKSAAAVALAVENIKKTDPDARHAAEGYAAVGSAPAARLTRAEARTAAEIASLAQRLDAAAIDPASGLPDHAEEFKVNFIDPRVWFANAILPDYWGVDARRILLDKSTMLALPRAITSSNDLSKRFALQGGLEGEIQARVEIDESGLKLRDGAVVKEGPGSRKSVKYRRASASRAAVHTNVDSRKTLNAQEYQDARYAMIAAHFIAGDGADGRMSTPVSLDLADIPWSSLATEDEDGRPGVEDAFDYEARQKKIKNGERPFASDVMMDRLTKVLNEGSPFYEQFIEKLKKHLLAAAKNHRLSTSYERAQSVYQALEADGWVVAQDRQAATQDREGTVRQLFNVRIAIPLTSVTAWWEGTAAHAKLLANGRTRDELDLVKVANEVSSEISRVDAHSAAMSWMSQGDGRLFGNSPKAPLFRGAGAYRAGMTAMMTKSPKGYEEAVRDQIASLGRIRLTKMAEKEDDETGDVIKEEVPISVDEAAHNQNYNRMFSYLRDMYPAAFPNGENLTPPEVAERLTHSDVRSALGLNPQVEPTLWDVALAVHRAASARLLDSAWNNGEKADVRMADVGLEAFNALITREIAERGGTSTRRGASFSEIYRITGAQPLSLGADEVLARHAEDMATQMRWRMALNQMLLATDHEGMPLYYAKPGANAQDDAVSEDMWGYVARMWVRIHGRAFSDEVYYDESASGRDNAARLYDVITKHKEAISATRQARGGTQGYILKTIELPPGMETFSGLQAMADPAGDDTKAALNVFAGGEAAAMAEQIMAVAGYTKVSNRWKYVNRFWSWSKSLSVMNSLFFPIATAFESPSAATGFMPTLLGFTGSGSRFMRWAGKNGGVVARAFGLDPNAPGMAEIMKYIGSDDPGLIELKIHAVAAGLQFSDRAKNMWDHDRSSIPKDIKNTTDKVRATMGHKAARNVNLLLNGMLESGNEMAFEYIINATKLAVFAQMNNRLRNRALREGLWWDPVRDMKKWAHYINAEVGGIDPAMYPWMTPQMQQWLKAGMFSWAWTLGAWSAGGGDVITAKLMGLPAGSKMRGFMFARWARMYFGVMIGVPAVMQVICTALGKIGGGDDDDDEDKKSAAGDKWGTWQNERSKRWSTWDITPALRAMKNAPALPVLASVGAIAGKLGGGWKGLAVGAAGAAGATLLAGLGGKTLGEAKEALPATVAGLPVGALIPANTGQEGAMATTRKRRYYMNLGKQGWEVARWFENPIGSFLAKMSLPAQKMLEGILGVNPASGFDTPFADMSFWERWTSLDGEKSALLNLGKAWLPFSYQGVIRNPEAGALSAVGVVSKGISKTAAVKEMATMFSQWADADGYAAMVKANPGAWTDLRQMAVEWLDALRLNGYNPKTELKNARALAMRGLYEKYHAALPSYPTGKGDIRALEEVARGMYRLNLVYKALLVSIKTRDRNQNIKRTGDFLNKSNRLLRESLENPHGLRMDERLGQSADLGGDVSGFLATDETPATILGYRVIGPEELSDSDKKFFEDNPDVAAFFEKGVK